MFSLLLRRTLYRLVVDESANALAEYALVMATVTIVSLLAFESLASTSSSVVGTNETNLSATGTANYSGQ